MIRKLSKYYIIICLIILSLSCDAPRNNPLDPENPDNNIATVEGFIRTITVPQTPIENVKVLCINEGLVTKTNSDGYFSFNNIERKDGWIVVEKENYSTDSLFITFENQ
ncbi:MAG: hypothetical protein OQJ81_08500, partial [Melioribacteraceae bacterium]|nr:hypothetical protein [Melioribacteraceae bacterium]